MALPIFNNLNPLVKISLNTLMQVGNTSRFRGYTYLGLMPYAIANSLPGQNPKALVSATRSYFRDGSDLDAERISYIALRMDSTSPIILIPEPLIQDGSVESGTQQVLTVRIEDNISREALAVILTGNGITKFNITAEVSS